MNRYWARVGTAPFLTAVRSAVARQSLLAPRLWVACVAAALAGVINAAAFPDLGWWPLVIPGTALMLWSFRARRAGGAFLVGLVYWFVYRRHVEDETDEFGHAAFQLRHRGSHRTLARR